MEWLAEIWSSRLDEAYLPVVTGLLVGMVFGSAAQRSNFCLRSATVEFWRVRAGVKFAIWLLTFSAALTATQIQFANGSLGADSIRQLATTGSISGAIVGGAIFGVGMVLARGCASRLLVLSATGNLRALVAGLILTIAAQASLTGVLSPVREGLSSLWLIPAEARHLANYLPAAMPLVFGIVLFVIAVILSWRSGLSPAKGIAAIIVGLAVAGGWMLTSWHASWSFDVVAVKSVSFTGPSADTLMALVNEPNPVFSFDTGLVPGVFAGSLVAAFIGGELRWQAFDAQSGMMRYLAGAVLMGFGGMLAGGCAVGAGVTGGSVMALTAWLALLSMWLAAGLADAFFDRHNDKVEELQSTGDLISVKATTAGAQ